MEEAVKSGAKLLCGGKRSGPLQPLLRGGARFASLYFLRAGFLDGAAGLVNAALAGTYAFLTYAKLWELGRGRSHTSPASAAPAPTATRPSKPNEPRVAAEDREASHNSFRNEL